MARDDDDDRELELAAGRNGPPIFLVLLIVVAVVTAIFIVQNGDPAIIEFLSFDFTSNLWTAIVIALLLGAVLDRLIIMWWRRSRRRN